jgi:hypothetical protein
MSLSKYFKLHIVNNTGATINFGTGAANNTFVIMGMPWKLTSGALVYGTEATIFADPSSDLTNGSSTEGSEIDNSSNLNLGYFCRADLQTDNASAGTVDIYVEYATATGVYPSDEADFDAEEDLIWVAQVVSGGTAAEHRGCNFTLGAMM